MIIEQETKQFSPFRPAEELLNEQDAVNGQCVIGFDDRPELNRLYVRRTIVTGADAPNILTADGRVVEHPILANDPDTQTLKTALNGWRVSFY